MADHSHTTDTNPIKYFCVWEAHVLLNVGRYEEIDA